MQLAHGHRAVSTKRLGAGVATAVAAGAVAAGIGAQVAHASTSYFYCNAREPVNAGCSGHWHHLQRNSGRAVHVRACIDEKFSSGAYTSANCAVFNTSAVVDYVNGFWALPRVWNAGPGTDSIHGREWF